MERLEWHVGELIGELVLQTWIEERPGREAPTDEVLPHPALRFMEGRRDALGQRRSSECGVDLTLVDAVAELVQAREDSVQRVLVEIGRKPDVRGRKRGREWMHGLVEPPRRAIHSPPLEHREPEAPLRVARKPAAQA